MEFFGVVLLVMIFTPPAVMWTLISRWRRFSRRTYIIGMAVILLIPTYSVVSGIRYMMVDEPLLSAAGDGNVAKVNALLRRGADPNAYHEGIASPLHAAAINGHTEVVRILLAHGANVNGCGGDHADVPLVSAAANGHTEIVRILLAHGADTSLHDGFMKMTPLQIAEEHGRKEVVEILKKAGAKE